MIMLFKVFLSSRHQEKVLDVQPKFEETTLGQLELIQVVLLSLLQESQS